MIAPENKSQIIEFVKAGKTKQAIELLVKSLESDELSLEYHKAILLSNRYYKHQNDITLGLKAEAHEMNDINHQILELLRNDGTQPTGSFVMGKAGKKKMSGVQILTYMTLGLAGTPLTLIGLGYLLIGKEKVDNLLVNTGSGEIFGTIFAIMGYLGFFSFIALLLALIASAMRGPR